MINESLFSSQSDEWSTPQEFFNRYDSIYHFTLDAASTDANAKCDNHFTIAKDGLKQNWGGANGMVESSIRTANREMGRKSLSRKPTAEHHSCLPTSSANRYEMVSQLLQARHYHFYPWSAKVWRKSQFSSIPIYGSCVSE